jgi:DNA-binding CsgD family transcriptional regulator
MSYGPKDNRAMEGHPLVAVVAAIGTAGFGRAVMAALAEGAGADMASAFALGPDGPDVLIAESVRAEASPFARIASLRYAHRHWRRDRETLFNLGRAHRSAVLARRSASAIHDLDYRHECYGAGAVGERLSVCRAGAVPLIVNAYRDAAHGRFPATAAAWIEAQAPLLIVAIERHRAFAARAEGPDASALARRLARMGDGLSPREAEVLAHTALGAAREATARALGLSVTSVATYRQRGYAKLGIRSRGELQAILRGGAGIEFDMR